MQNSLARVVCRSGFQSRSADLLKRLHWLPVNERIRYKLAVLTFKSRLYGKPSYLADLLTPYQPKRNLRSSDSATLTVPDVFSAGGRRAFAFAAPAL